MNDNSGWPVYRTQKQEIQYRTTATDSSGRFELSVAKTITGKYPALWIFVSAEGMAPQQKWLAPRLTAHNIEIELAEAKTARAQLVDAIGNPVAGITPELWHAYTPKGENSFWLPDPEARGAGEVLAPVDGKRLAGLYKLRVGCGDDRGALWLTTNASGIKSINSNWPMNPWPSLCGLDCTSRGW